MVLCSFTWHFAHFFEPVLFVLDFSSQTLALKSIKHRFIVVRKPMFWVSIVGEMAHNFRIAY